MAYGQLGNTGGSRPPGTYGAYGKGGSAPGRVSGTAARTATVRTASAKTRAAAAAKRTKQAIEKKAAEGPKLIARGTKKGEIKPDRQSKASKKFGKKVVSQAMAGVPYANTGKTIGSSKSGETVTRTKALQKYEAQAKKGYAQNRKANSKKYGYM